MGRTGWTQSTTPSETATGAMASGGVGVTRAKLPKPRLRSAFALSKRSALVGACRTTAMYSTPSRSALAARQYMALLVKPVFSPVAPG